MRDFIYEIYYEVSAPENMMLRPDKRIIYTLHEPPHAQTLLEENYAPQKVTILSVNHKRYLPLDIKI